MVKLKKFIIKLLAPFKRMGLSNRDFSIISNNCYGGIITRNFGLPYNSPTCGLFFFSKEYIKFLSDLKKYLEAELTELKVSDSRYKNELMPKYGQRLVLGKILDVEIVFLHYIDFDEAKEKWDRRKFRINWDNLVIKYNDQNLFTITDYYEFKKLPYKNKIFFTANPLLRGEENVIYFECDQSNGYVVNDIKTAKRYFDIKKYLNGLNKHET